MTRGTGIVRTTTYVGVAGAAVEVLRRGACVCGFGHRCRFGPGLAGVEQGWVVHGCRNVFEDRKWDGMDGGGPEATWTWCRGVWLCMYAGENLPTVTKFVLLAGTVER